MVQRPGETSAVRGYALRGAPPWYFYTLHGGLLVREGSRAPGPRVSGRSGWRSLDTDIARRFVGATWGARWWWCAGRSRGEEGTIYLSRGTVASLIIERGGLAFDI